MRQIALHINDQHGYGSAVLGLHMYTCVFVLCIIAIIYIAIALGLSSQYEIKANKDEIAEARGKKIKVFTHIVFVLLVFIVAANLVSTFAECGLSECPDNPTVYTLWH